ncbi:MAG: LysE family translocator [Candidatus Dormibacterales bacterium]
MSSLLLRGFALGFAIAASPGPIFFLCVRRTLVRGRLYGLASGLGVATADGMYGAIAVFGVTALTATFVSGRRPLALVGGLVLVALGVRILVDKQSGTDNAPPSWKRGLISAYLSTVGLTITNPATILSFAALAATLGLGANGGFARPASVVAGVLLGSAAWWCLLVAATSILRKRLTPNLVRVISAFSGFVIIILGSAAVISSILGAI